MISTTPPLAEPINVQQPSCADSDTFVESEIASIIGLAEVDPQIIEALKSKDRIYVLKLGEQMESLINDRRCVLLSSSLRTTSLDIKYCVTLRGAAISTSRPNFEWANGFYLASGLDLI